MTTSVTGSTSGGVAHHEAASNQLTQEAAQLINVNTLPAGVVDVDRLAQVTRDHAASEGRDLDELGGEVARQLEERDPRDAQAYLVASKAARPYAQTQYGGKPSTSETRTSAPGTAARNPLGFPERELQKLPNAANDTDFDPGRVPLKLLSRAGVLSITLMLSGDTPQPKTEAHQVPGTSDLAVVQVRDGATNAVKDTYFAKVEQRPMPAARIVGYPIGPTVGKEQVLTRLPVEAKIENGEFRYDPAALEKAYGKPIPGWTAPTSGRSPTDQGAVGPPTVPGLTNASGGSSSSSSEDSPVPSPAPLTPDELAHMVAMRRAGASTTQVAAELQNRASNAADANPTAKQARASSENETPSQEKTLTVQANEHAARVAGTSPDAGSSEHKEAAWNDYEARGGKWKYDQWSNVYDANMTRATAAHAAADAYRSKIGWGEREVTVKVQVDGETHTRRLDIADAHTQRGIEYKTGDQYLTKETKLELDRDADLVKRGWDIKWIFSDYASQPLREALTAKGIPYQMGNNPVVYPPRP